jgi:hypothetical protein
MSLVSVEPPAATVAFICCGRRLKQVGVGRSRAEMSFTYCDGCDSMRWFRDDLPINGNDAPPLVQPGDVAGMSAVAQHP